MAWKVFEHGGHFFRELLDTHGRIVTFGTILGAIGGGWLVGAVAKSMASIGGMYLVAVMLLATGLFVIIAGVAVSKIPLTNVVQQDQHGQQQALVVDAPKVADLDAAYYKIDKQLTSEIETPLRVQVNKLPAADRENFLVRFITVGWIEVMFEEIWLTPIFGSQISALEKLNTGSVKRVELFPFYADTAKANPKFFANYSYDQWLGYMRGQILVREDGDMVSITVKGREFLRHLIEKGRSSSQRSF